MHKNPRKRYRRKYLGGQDSLHFRFVGSLLLQTDMAIWALSDKLGFVDPSYFSKMFKAKNGLTPAAFRKKL
jgi:YesN/AraC family two-component response regulator